MCLNLRRWGVVDKIIIAIAKIENNNLIFKKTDELIQGVIAIIKYNI